MITKLLEQMRNLHRSSSYLLEYPTDIEGLLEQNRKIKAALGYTEGKTMNPIFDENDINVLKTTIAMYKTLCADIAKECEKSLGRKMDEAGLYKYVCDALESARNY